MRGRYSALSVLALCAGVGGGVFLERLYLNPSDMAANDGPEILYWVAPMDAIASQNTMALGLVICSSIPIMNSLVPA